jgi:hypothetical protein
MTQEPGREETVSWLEGRPGPAWPKPHTEVHNER